MAALMNAASADKALHEAMGMPEMAAWGRHKLVMLFVMWAVMMVGSEVGPGAIATYGKSTADKADAFGFKWERTGQSSKHIRFDWSGPDS
jgi:hypothetical protein